MKDYGSNLYFGYSLLAAVVVGGVFFYYSENLIIGGVAGFSVFIVYNWFSKVLYGLEENGNILQEISQKLGKDLPDDIEDDEVEYLSEEENIEDDLEEEEEEEEDNLTQKEDFNEKNTNNNSEHWLEKKEIGKTGILIAIFLPIAFVIYVLFLLIS